GCFAVSTGGSGWQSCPCGDQTDKGGGSMTHSDEHQAFKDEQNIHTDFKESMTYSDYLGLDTLLSSQHPLSDHHDEMLFITVHHVSEVWMKLILHEVDAAIYNIQSDNLSSSFKKLARVSQVQEKLKRVWDVLATLTPSEYIEFRDKLGNASGFQSYQNRLFEFALGYKMPHVLKIYEKDPVLLEKLKVAYTAPSLYDVSIRALVKAGLTIR